MLKQLCLCILLIFPQTGTCFSNSFMVVSEFLLSFQLSWWLLQFVQITLSFSLPKSSNDNFCHCRLLLQLHPLATMSHISFLSSIEINSYMKLSISLFSKLCCIYIFIRENLIQFEYQNQRYQFRMNLRLMSKSHSYSNLKQLMETK